MRDVSYAPRSQVAAWLRKGWRLEPSHDYCDDDWAIVMILPASPEPLSEAEIDRIARRFRKPFSPIVIRSNKSNAAIWRNELCQESRRANRSARATYDSRRLVQESA